MVVMTIMNKLAPVSEETRLLSIALVSARLSIIIIISSRSSTRYMVVTRLAAPICNLHKMVHNWDPGWDSLFLVPEFCYFN